MEPHHPNAHIRDDLLSEYALGRLPAERVTVVFEHLIVCDECSDRFDAEFDVRQYLRAAMASAAAPEPVRRRDWLNVFAVPKPAWGVIAALAVFATFVPVLRQQAAGPVQVLQLTALRGAENDSTARVGNAVRLHLVTTGIDTSRPAEVQIADQSGNEVWSGTATVTASDWQVQPERSFPAGRYWVRVIDPQRPEPSVREYSFEVR